MEEFAERIKRLRIARGMTQVDLGNELGVSAQAVSKWETGMATPDIALLPALARLFKTTIDNLLIGEEPTSMPPASELQTPTVVPDALPSVSTNLESLVEPLRAEQG